MTPQYINNNEEAVAILQAHCMLAYPTETFYGLGCAALHPEALDALERTKPRNAKTNPYPLILGSVSQLSQVARPLPSGHPALSLIEHFWPGPLTLVLPAVSGLDPRIVGPQGGVAVRVSSHPWASALALSLKQPIISTSANPTGKPPPREASDVFAYFKGHSLGILDGGSCAGGAPSTIVDFTGASWQILRMGAISEEKIRFRLLNAEDEMLGNGLL